MGTDESTEPNKQSDTNGPEKKADLGVLVGLPAYNEAVGIGSVILSAQEFADEVVVVDGSADRTVEIVEAAGTTVIKRGKGGN